MWRIEHPCNCQGFSVLAILSSSVMGKAAPSYIKVLAVCHHACCLFRQAAAKGARRAACCCASWRAVRRRHPLGRLRPCAEALLAADSHNAAVQILV